MVNHVESKHYTVQKFALHPDNRFVPIYYVLLYVIAKTLISLVMICPHSPSVKDFL